NVDMRSTQACCVWLVGENFAGTGVLQVTPYLASTGPSGLFACVGLGNSGASIPYSYNCYYGSGYGPYGSGNIQTMDQNGEPYQINCIHGIDYSSPNRILPHPQPFLGTKLSSVVGTSW